jgi:hypothetical protein
MLEVALSAADFNKRFNSKRPISFLDLHTNTSQVSRNTQAGRITVQALIRDVSTFRYIQEETELDGGKLETQQNEGKKLKTDLNGGKVWKTAYDDFKPSKYPIAVLPSQHQDIVSLYYTLKLGTQIGSRSQLRRLLKKVMPRWAV